MSRRQQPALNPIDSLLALAKGMALTFKTMFRRTDTVQYPFERKQPFPRTHGRHLLNRYANGMEKCIGCELCAGACPADAILVWGADNPPDNPVSPGERYGVVYQINMLRCIFCGLCVEACPTDAITFTNFFDFTAQTRSSLIYTKDELLQQPPFPEREKFGYDRDPIVLSQEEMQQPVVGSLRGEPAQPPEGKSDVPVVWLPQELWQGPSGSERGVGSPEEGS